jgi:DNA-binding winged helix-turn-helix (wHTH) protein/tetratricopeptide (TPR) repeat protein
VTDEPSFVFPPFELDRIRGELRRGAEGIALRRKTFAVLRHLIERAGALVTTEELLDAVWPGTYVSDGVLKVCITELRKALGDDPGAPRYIETVHGQGYRFVAGVRCGRPVDRGAEVHPDRYVGRTAEVEALRATAQRALAGSGRLVLLAGDAGIGKTRTAEELAVYARDHGAQVLVGRCSEESRATAFWPWVQAIRTYVAGADAALLRDVMGEAGADLAPLVPAVYARLPDVPAPPALSPEEARFRLFDGVASFLCNAARRQPVLLFADDLHWADRSSLQLLRFVAREIAAAPVLIVGAYRDVELPRGHPLADALVELTREPVCTRLTLRGLAAADVQHFLAQLAGAEVPAAFTAAMYARTEGNPFFIQEMLRHLLEEKLVDPAAGRWPIDLSIEETGIPAGVRTVVARRLAGLSAACRHALTVGALIGRVFGLDVLTLVRGDEPVHRPLDQLLEAIEEAIAARVLARAGQRYRYAFAHPLLREVLCADLTPTRRARLHGQIGAALERVHGYDAEGHAAELAHHFVEAAAAGHDVARAVRYARQAGDHAISLVAYEAAVEQYERAWRVLDAIEGDVHDADRYELLMSLGEARAGAGNLESARDAYRQAADIARRAGTPAQLARAALGCALEPRGFDAAAFQSEWLVALLEEAAARLAVIDSALRAKVLARLARTVHPSLPAARREALSREAVEVARRAGYPSTLAAALYTKRWAPWGSEDAGQRLATTTEMVRLAEQAGDRAMSQEGRLWRIVTLLELGEVTAMHQEIEAYARCADAARQPRYRWVAAWLRAMEAVLAGRFEEGEALALEALSIGQRVHERYAVRAYGVQLFGLRHAQGRLHEIEPALAGFVTAQRADVGWRCSLAALYSELGRTGEARAEFEALAADDFAALSEDMFRLAALGILAETCAVLDDAARARTLYAQLTPYAERTIVVGAGLHCLGSVARSLGRLAGTMARWAEATIHYEAALRVNQRLASPPLLARTQLDYAQMLLAQNAATPRAARRGKQKALELIAAAHTTARELGMQALAATAETLT